MTSLFRSLSAAIVVVLLVVSCTASTDSDRLASNAQSATALATVDMFEVPTSAEAGDTITVTVRSDSPDGTVIRIAAFGATTAIRAEAVLVDGAGSATFGPPLTTHAGIVSIAAASEDGTVTRNVTITAAPVVDPLVPLVGPRTIVANGQDFTMATVTATDEWGNPVADGTEITYRIEREDGTATTGSSIVEGGVAAARIPSTTRTGRTAIAVESGDAAGPIMTIDEVAGNPAPFDIEFDTRTAVADGLTTHRVQTRTVVDEWNNTLPDGVIVEFIFSSQSGRGIVNTTMQNGLASAEFVAPSKPGPTVILARVSGVDSDPIIIDFEPAFDTLPSIVRDRGDVVEVVIGPVVSTGGGWIPDGTPVAVGDLADGDLVIASGAINDGRATILVDRDAWPRAAAVEVLGIQQALESP